MTERTARGLVRYHDEMEDNARWDDFVFRPGDIVISTPPKAGTTWAQMICALLVFRSKDLPRPLDEISPWLEMKTRSLPDLFALLEGQRHRRLLKSHTPFDGLPYDERATYLCVGRDPRDIAVSLHNHQDNMDYEAFLAAKAGSVGLEEGDEREADGTRERSPQSFTDWFVEWVESDDPDRMKLSDVMHHLASFWREQQLPNVLLLHYGELKDDLEGQMRRLAADLGIDVPSATWPSLVDAATFASMKSRADVLAPESSFALWRDNSRFFNKGTSGQWKALLDGEALERYTARVHELADPDLVRWLHRD